jgi:hypothetical protein
MGKLEGIGSFAVANNTTSQTSKVIKKEAYSGPWLRSKVIGLHLVMVFMLVGSQSGTEYHKAKCRGT